MKHEERELKLNELQAIARRIIDAKHYLFIGNPYTSDLKPNKRKTYYKLVKMHSSIIDKVCKLFT